jgi:hypothetical protein
VVPLSGTRSGAIWLSKKTWPKSGRSPAGIWIENVRLEQLSSDDSDPPLASIWIGGMANEGINIEDAKNSIQKEATRLIPAKKLATAVKSLPDDEYAIGFQFCSKKEIVEWIADPEGTELAEHLTDELECLAKLAPVLDSLMANRVKK